MSTILENLQVRLTEELRRVGLKAVAASTGISRATLYNWMEKGNTPLDKLALLDAAGLDVNYILTGVRHSSVSVVVTETSLTKRQSALLDNYEHTDEAGKKIIEATAAEVAQQIGPMRKSS
ncbi:helix-turn-helix domain-containing protein [Serratia marcescens]